MTKATTRDILSFRWRYILLPLSILCLSILLSAYFYHLLPNDVAYHFKSDGSADRWLSREITIVWALAPQIFLTMVAGGLTWGITKLGILSGQAEDSLIKLEGTLIFMSNIIALPQVILCFAMLDIFSYNSYQIHIMPIWLFALIIMGLGVVVLGVFFIRNIRRVQQSG
jgi:uncharacterized membrane protein